MKLELSYPYSVDYKLGYLQVNKEPRRLVNLVSNGGEMTSVSYARYLMACELKRYLTDDEHVDHIDGDKLNDVISNLQILSRDDNNKKRLKEYNITRKYVLMICPNCNNHFERKHNQTHLCSKKKKVNFCSRNCLHSFLKNGYSNDELYEFGQNQIIEIFNK